MPECGNSWQQLVVGPTMAAQNGCGLPDPLVVFHPLKRDELGEVLELELGLVQKRVLESTTRPFLFRVTTEGRPFLLEEGTDQRYGARQVKRAIELYYLVGSLARLLATGQVHSGDVWLSWPVSPNGAAP
jgi:ATP-dependent Clp protease ATP-binding subunit ClpA